MRVLRGAWFVCAVVFGTAASLFALDIRYVTVDGVQWEYTVNERVGDAYVRGFSPHVKSVVVPAALDGHPVTRIDGYLVQNDTSVEVIGIPASVRYLTYGNNNNPFMGARALKGFRVDADNPYFASDNGLLYSKDKSVLYAVPGALASVTLPSCLKVINTQAFQQGTIKGVELPDGLVEIGSSAFCECRGITSMKIPGSVRKIGTSAFAWCMWMADIQFAEGLETLGGRAFYCCHALRSVKLPRTLREIGGGTFGWCDAMDSVDYPRGVKIDSSDEFYKCSPLMEIKYHGLEAFPSHVLNDVNPGCVVYVSRHSYGWGVEIPGTYNGRRIEFLSAEDAVEDEKTRVDPTDGAYRDWVCKYFKVVSAATYADILEQPAANPKYTVAGAYTAGLDPTDPTAEFRVVMTFDGKGYPEVSWDPKILNPDEEAKRRYLILGKDQLTDPWTIVYEGESWRYNFFQVVVEMR